MKYALVFSSQSSNTALLAEQIKVQLPLEDCVYYGEPGALALAAPLLLVGKRLILKEDAKKLLYF